MTDLTVIKNLKVTKFESQEEWESYVIQLSMVNQNVQFLIGDAILAGEQKGWVSSDTYDQVEVLTGLARSTIKNYVMIARRFGPDKRNEKLGFEAHKIVSSLPLDEQFVVLEEAADKGLSTRELKKVIKASTQEEEVEPGPPLPTSDFDAEDTEYQEVIEDEEELSHTINDIPGEPLNVTDNAKSAFEVATHFYEVAREFEADGMFLNEFANWMQEYINENY